jgi:hypothetical protein
VPSFSLARSIVWVLIHAMRPRDHEDAQLRVRFLGEGRERAGRCGNGGRGGLGRRGRFFEVGSLVPGISIGFSYRRAVENMCWDMSDL